MQKKSIILIILDPQSNKTFLFSSNRAENENNMINIMVSKSEIILKALLIIIYFILMNYFKLFWIKISNISTKFQN